MKLSPETVAEALADTRACAAYDAEFDGTESWHSLYRPHGGLKEQLEDEIRSGQMDVAAYTRMTVEADQYMRAGRFGAEWMELCPTLAKRQHANLNKAAAAQRKVNRAQKTLDELLRKMAEMESGVAA